MKKRIAKKILDIYGTHWVWHKGEYFCAFRPKDMNRYYEACKVLKKSPFRLFCLVKKDVRKNRTTADTM